MRHFRRHFCVCGHSEAEHDPYPTVLDDFEEQCLVRGCTCTDFKQST